MSIVDYREGERSVAVIGFSAAERQAIGHAVAVAGGRLLPVAGDQLPFADLVVLDVLDAAGLEALPGGESAIQLLVRASLATVDEVEARWPLADIVIGDDPVELHLTLAIALRRAGIPAAAFDVASEEGLRLQRLADEIGRIARTLIELPDGLGTPGGNVGDRAMTFRGPPAADADGANDTITSADVRAIIRWRRMRDRYFPGELFADPAWDMLLDLAAARIDRTRVAVSSLCIAAAVPPTTALRWIKAMTDKGLLRRIADPHDARRIFIQLSDDAALAMDKYLRAARASAALPV